MSVSKVVRTDPIPDYELRSEDHRTVLILVKQIGNIISQKSFTKIYESIKKIEHFKVLDSGTTRCIKIRYETDYPPENNEWGDFQTHRKVLGLISIGKCDADENIEELSNEHCVFLEQYNNTVYDSRCFVFGSDSVSPSDNNETAKFSSDEKAVSPECTHSPVIDNFKSDVFKDNVEPVPKSHLVNEDIFDYSLISTNNSPKSDTSEGTIGDSLEVASFSPDFNSLPNFNSNFEESSNGSSFTEVNGQTSNINSIQKTSCVPPCSVVDSNLPGSKKFIISSNSSHTTHCIIYPSIENCEHLEKDLREFVNSVFWILESKRMDRSFEKQEKLPFLVAPFEKRSFVGIDTDTKTFKKRCLGRMKKHVGDLALQAGLPLEAFSLYTACIDNLKSVQDWLWLAAAYEGQCSASLLLQFEAKDFMLSEGSSESHKTQLPKMRTALNLVAHQSKSLPLNLDPMDVKNVGKSMFSVEELADKYGEAILHYQKYHGALIIEMECCMKAARAFMNYKKYLDATKILQNVVFTAVVQTEEEKLIRFNALAKVFTEIGFHRKASFFKRIAAMRSVSAMNPKPNWTKCYYLLLESLKGFRLPLDVTEFSVGLLHLIISTHVTVGWPTIQVQMLYDIIGVSKMMNNQAISVRHITFVLQTLMNILNIDQQQDLCRQLEELTAKCEGAPVPLILENGITIPPVNLLNLPRVKSFKLQNLAPHLRPVKMTTNELKAVTEQESIFIFSPIPRHTSAQGSSNIDFKWVEGDVCEVILQVFNPLPFELKVTHMGILADSIPFESFPACLSLPAESGPYPVTLLGKPLDPGKLQVLGYTTHVLGVKSSCRLIDIPSIRKPYFTIDVIPSLPSIQLSTSLPKASMFSSLEDTSYVVISATSTMYNGESQECTITITNPGKEAVEWIDISLHSKLKKDIESSFFTWSKENVDTQLPIAAGSTASFTLYINAIANFTLGKPDNDRSRTTSVTSASPRRRAENICQPLPPEPFATKTVEALLQLQYSGGPGMEAGYCRQCAIALTIEVLPSIVITEWDVLPSETPTHCYLVFDIQNATSNEMEVVYASNKRILIEANDVCRVPVPVERCSLSVMSSSFGEIWASVDICGHLWKYLDDKTDQRKAKLLTACRKHLENLVDLQWTLTLEISGKASISEITWTEDMLGFILMSPLRWDVRINGKDFKPEMEFNFLLGDLVTFSIKLLNVSDVSLLNLNLFVRGYQDYQNGRQNYHLETKRAVSGRDRIHIEEIKPHEEFSHECGFIFFNSGVYKVDILCSHNDPMMLQTPSLLDLDTDSIASIRGKKTKNIHPKSRYTDPCLIQKCSPTIDLTILED